MAGKAKRSNVWNYFKYCEEEDKSICHIVMQSSNGNDEVTRGKEICGRYATNLKKHLKSYHNDEYQQFERDERNRRVGSSTRKGSQDSLVQQTMENSFNRPSYYSKESNRHADITKKLAVFIGSTNAPLSLVDCEEFSDLLSEMDRKYDIPHRWKLGQEINKLYDRLKHNISLHLENAKRVILCCDVWFKQGMTASFFGHYSALFYSS